jgi:hypothetical protein
MERGQGRVERVPGRAKREGPGRVGRGVQGRVGEREPREGREREADSERVGTGGKNCGNTTLKVREAQLQTLEKVECCKCNRVMETSAVEGIGDKMV